MLQHFLLTRMNTAAPFGVPGVSLDENWLEHRFSLFERYTLPAVRAQVNCDAFEWLLFTHERTPERFRRRLVEYSEKFAPIHLVECTEFDEHVARAAVESRIGPDATHVITSRVDNDDALGRTFLAAVQREFRDQSGEFINFDLGFQLYDGRVYRSEHPSNPYCSAIEARANFKGVFAVSHMDIEAVYPVKHVRDKRRWLTVIHGQNALNVVEGERCRSVELADEFNWLVAEFRDGKLDMLTDTVGRRLHRTLDTSLVRARGYARARLRKES
jgi:hypothetical protein